MGLYVVEAPSDTPQLCCGVVHYVSTVHSDAEELIEKTDVAGMGQTQEPELSEDMMAFAFAMGE